MKRFFDKCIDKIAKSSLVFFCIISFSITLIVALSLYIRTDDMLTESANISNRTICIESVIEIHADKVFVYLDRNDKVYSVGVKSTYNENGKTYIVVTEEDALNIEKLTDIKVDIPISQTTVFERIFLKGGKNK